MSNKPTGTKDDPLPMPDIPMNIRLFLIENREDGLLYSSPDCVEYFFQPRDTTFTRAQESRILELIGYELDRRARYASSS